MKLKINNVKGYNGVITIGADVDGVPLSKFWRDRLKDSKIDNCVEVIKPSKPKKDK